MKVLMMIRSDALRKHGGDCVQMLEYQRALSQLGVEVSVTTATVADFARYDLVHLFNLGRPLETFAQMRRAKSSSKPVVLSSIYQARRFVQAYERLNSDGILSVGRFLPGETLGTLKDLARVVRGSGDFKGWWELTRKGRLRGMREILELVDAVILLAHAEGNEILADFGILPQRRYVIYNGYDGSRYASSLPAHVSDMLGSVSEFVLSVGRVEAGKNQLGIVRSLADTGLPVVFVGGANPWHRRYVQRFKREVASHPNMFYLGWVEPRMMPALYERARVHVLASWFEVAPLVDLEAAWHGCQVVTTTRSYAPEYAADFAVFCEPDDSDSIRSAVVQAYERGRNIYAMRVVRERFSWKKAGEGLLRVYEEVLSGGRHAAGLGSGDE